MSINDNAQHFVLSHTFCWNFTDVEVQLLAEFKVRNFCLVVICINFVLLVLNRGIDMVQPELTLC